MASLLAITLSAVVWSAPHAAAPEAQRVLLVGVDGMTFDVIDPMIRAGKLPTLARLLDGGARAVLTSERPMRSPALWTTIATGEPRSVHDIYDFVTGSAYWPRSQRSREQKLVTSGMRKARALWQYATDANQPSIVVGWLNTWPAEPVLGAMVAPYVALGKAKQTSIKGRIWQNGTKRQTYPADLFDELRTEVVPAEAVSDELVARLVDEPQPRSPLWKQVPLLHRYLYTVRWSLATALTNTAIVTDLLRKEPDSKLVMTYFDGTDTLAHRFWIMREPVPKVRERLAAEGMNPELAAELKRRLGSAVDGYYEVVDASLAKLWDAAGPNANVFVVSDHGWGASKGAKAYHHHVPFDGEHRLEGVFIAHGPAIKAGHYAPLSLYDITPTTLALLGIAVPEGLRGRVTHELLNADKLQTPAAPQVANRDAGTARAKKGGAPREAAGTSEAPFREQEIERLKSLGYVQ